MLSLGKRPVTITGNSTLCFKGYYVSATQQVSNELKIIRKASKFLEISFNFRIV